jgi:membrane associated rhomboid family serine protease
MVIRMAGQEQIDGPRTRAVQDWPDGEVWFLERIPDDIPWGDEGLIEELPDSAKGAYGLKVDEYVYIDGQRYKPGNYITVGSVEEIERLMTQVKKPCGFFVPWYDRLISVSLWRPHHHRIDKAEYRQRLRQRFFKSLALCVGLIALGLFRPQFLMMAIMGVALFGLYPLVESVMAWFRPVDRYSVDELNDRLVRNEFFSRWVGRQPTGLVKVAVGVLGVVFLGQYLVDYHNPVSFPGIQTSIQEAALVKAAVREDGEWWRLITTGLLHGNLIHIVFNGMALFSLGRVIVALVSPSLLSIVFLVSVVTGSLASLFLGQAPASVGASGGILGCLGFLIVVTRKFRDQLPDYLRANLIMSCVVIAIFGLMGSQFIDNAAHAGGFIGGVVLGELLYSQLKLVPGSTRKSIGLVSIISITILLAGVAKVFWEFWSVSQSLFGSA